MNHSILCGSIWTQTEFPKKNSVAKGLGLSNAEWKS